MNLWRRWIIERWNKGQRNGRQTLPDLRTKGSIGNCVTVLRYLIRQAAMGLELCLPLPFS